MLDSMEILEKLSFTRPWGSAEEKKAAKYIVIESDVSQQEKLRKYAEDKGLISTKTRGYQSVFLLK